MLNVNLSTGKVIANESSALFDAADNALLSSARMTVTLLEAAIETPVDPRTKQRLLEAMNTGQSKLVECRKSFTDVHSQLVVLQRRTNLAEVSWGCQDVPRLMTCETRRHPSKDFSTRLLNKLRESSV